MSCYKCIQKRDLIVLFKFNSKRDVRVNVAQSIVECRNICLYQD